MNRSGEKGPLQLHLPFSEEDLLKDLDWHSAHGDALAQPSENEIAPLERLRGSVKKYERPTEPVWDEYFSGDGVSDDFMKDRDQPSPQEPE